jgi:Uma2 family endonuclease
MPAGDRRVLRVTAAGHPRSRCLAAENLTIGPPAYRPPPVEAGQANTMVTTRLVTGDELLAMPKQGRRCELIAGELRPMPMAGGEHGQIETEFLYSLRDDLKRHPLGRVFPGDTGVFFSHEPEFVLFPDVTFVRSERLPPPAALVGFLDVIPDLVVEIISPSERAGDACPEQSRRIEAKIAFYLERGVRLVWVAYLRRGLVVAHSPGHEPWTRAAGDDLTTDDLLPGFRLPVADIFR